MDGSFPPWVLRCGWVLLVLLSVDVFGAARSLNEQRLHAAERAWQSLQSTPREGALHGLAAKTRSVRDSVIQIGRAGPSILESVDSDVRFLITRADERPTKYDSDVLHSKAQDDGDLTLPG